MTGATQVAHEFMETENTQPFLRVRETLLYLNVFVLSACDLQYP